MPAGFPSIAGNRVFPMCCPSLALIRLHHQGHAGTQAPPRSPVSLISRGFIGEKKKHRIYSTLRLELGLVRA